MRRYKPEQTKQYCHLCIVGKQVPCSASTRFKLVPSKIIHWIIFEVNLCMQSVLGPLFSCKRGPNSRKCAFTNKMFHTLRSAPKGSAFRIRELFVEKQVKNKFSTTKNFSFCCNERSRRQATYARARVSGLHLTDNANRVQAQPASFLDIRLSDHR